MNCFIYIEERRMESGKVYQCAKCNKEKFVGNDPTGKVACLICGCNDWKQVEGMKVDKIRPVGDRVDNEFEGEMPTSNRSDY